jgi:hypothetical protein
MSASSEKEAPVSTRPRLKEVPSFWWIIRERFAANSGLHNVLLVALLLSVLTGIVFLLLLGGEKYSRHARELRTPVKLARAVPGDTTYSSPRPDSPEETEKLRKAVAGARRRAPPDRAEFFRALQSTLQSGEPVLSIDLETTEETVLFRSWAQAAKGNGTPRRLELRFLKRDSDGIFHFELLIEETPIRGVLKARFLENAWQLVGVEPSRGGLSTEAD